MTTIEDVLALAEKYGEAAYADDCGHFPEGASRPRSKRLRDAIVAYGDARAAAAVLAERERAERLRAKLQEIGDFAASCATGPGLREALAMIEQMVAAPGEQQP